MANFIHIGEVAALLCLVGVAAAVVVYKASWGWDETAQMSTRVNDREIRASAKFDETNWIVQEHTS